jgi:hypothetical protein
MISASDRGVILLLFFFLFLLFLVSLLAHLHCLPYLLMSLGKWQNVLSYLIDRLLEF